MVVRERLPPAPVAAITSNGVPSNLFLLPWGLAAPNKPSESKRFGNSQVKAVSCSNRAILLGLQYNILILKWR